MQTIKTVRIVKGAAHKSAGIKSHATRYQYEYIGSITDIPPQEKHLNILNGSFKGCILCPQ